jgi:hypothetical protein
MPLRLPRRRCVTARSTGHIIWWADHATADTLMKRAPAAIPIVNPVAQLIAMFGMFIAGGLLGWGLSSWAAPGSGLGAAVSGLLLPSSFAAGLVMWAGVEIVTAVLDRIRARSRDSCSSDLAARSAVWFVPACLASTCPGGFLVGVLPGGEGPLVSTLAYAAVGAAYGRASGWLAAKGYLPAPHSE